MYVIETRGKRQPWIKLAEQRAKRLAVEHAFMLAEELERAVRVVEYGREFKVIARDIRPGMVAEAKAALLGEGQQHEYVRATRTLAAVRAGMTERGEGE
jgi:hypothetical protein